MRNRQYGSKDFRNYQKMLKKIRKKFFWDPAGLELGTLRLWILLATKKLLRFVGTMWDF